MGPLNWKELEILVSRLRPEVEGAFLDRIIIPQRPKFPQGYLKNEYILRLTSRERECALLLSFRNRLPYLGVYSGRGPKAAETATRAAFDLAATKVIRGARLERLEAYERERTIALWFSAAEGGARHALIVSLIPAAPEAFIVAEVRAEVRKEEPAEVRAKKSSEKSPHGFSQILPAVSPPLLGDLTAPPPAQAPGTQLRILARSRVNAKLKDGDNGQIYTPPDGARAPADPPVREELVREPQAYLRAIETELDREAYGLRKAVTERLLRDTWKQAGDRARQTETALTEARNEPDWRRYGDLLKATLGQPPELEVHSTPKGPVHIRRVLDYESAEEGTRLALKCDPQLGPSAQVEKFYQMSKRKARRLTEADSRLQTLRESARSMKARLDQLTAAPEATPEHWRQLADIERGLGIASEKTLDSKAMPAKNDKKRTAAWLGKTFHSKDGILIWVGKSRIENLELTFKHARGNDLWLHVRGRPGAHAVIPLQSGKSAPLDTLIDAATLVIYYSGGDKWGKTEVDYTFKKYVKRIKDSDEASYTGNKTLIVDIDPVRLKRLLDGKN